MAANDKAEKRCGLFLWSFFLCLYCLSGKGRFGSSDPETRLQLAVNLYERHTLTFDEQQAKHYYVSKAKGRYVSWFFPGQSVAFLLCYALAKPFLPFFPEYFRQQALEAFCSFTPCLFGAGTIFFFFLVLGHLGYGLRIRLLTALLLGLGSIFTPYAKYSQDPVQAMFFLALGLHLLLQGETRSNWWSLAAGLAMGMAFFTRITYGIDVAGWLLFWTLRLLRKEGLGKSTLLKFLSAGTGILPFGLLMLAYNYWRYGQWSDYYFNICGKLNIPLFSYPLGDGLFHLVLNPWHSFFLYTPFFLLLIFPLHSFAKKHPELLLGSGVILLGQFLLSAKNYSYYSFTLEWGVRYLVTTCLVFGLYTAELLEQAARSKKRVFQALILSVCLLSVVMQFLAVLTPLEHVGYLAFEGREKLGFPGFLYSREYCPLRLLGVSFRIILVNFVARPFPGNMRNLDVSSRHLNNRDYLNYSLALNYPDLWWYHALGISSMRGATLVIVCLLMAGTVYSSRQLLWFLRRDQYPL